MIVTPSQKNLIEHIVNVFETGTPTGDYGEVCTYLDGHNGTRQITYGRAQTTEQGNLKDLIRLYIALDGSLATGFERFVDDIGVVPLAGDAQFIALMKQAGADPIMQKAEDQFFDFDYFTPAKNWATTNGFVTALGMLVIYDSFIHSGGILNFLRARFGEKPPAQMGDEDVWLKEYVFVRGEWLGNYNDPSSPEKTKLLRSTTYRTSCLMREIVRKNFDLSQVPINANGVEVSS